VHFTPYVICRRLVISAVLWCRLDCLFSHISQRSLVANASLLALVADILPLQVWTYTFLNMDIVNSSVPGLRFRLVNRCVPGPSLVNPWLHDPSLVNLYVNMSMAIHSCFYSIRLMHWWSVSGTSVKSPVSKPEIICNRRLITRLFETRFWTTSLVKLTGDQLTLDFDLPLVDDAIWRLAIGWRWRH